MYHIIGTEMFPKKLQFLDNSIRISSVVMFYLNYNKIKLVQLQDWIHMHLFSFVINWLAVVLIISQKCWR